MARVCIFFYLSLPVSERGPHYAAQAAWPQTHNPPASASKVPGLLVCTTTPSSRVFILH
jgi:hypothetical protein